MFSLKTVFVILFLSIINTLSMADDIKLVMVKFQEPFAPKYEYLPATNSYTNHFFVSAGYRIQVELSCQIPVNKTFAVRTYALINGNKVPLGDARIGKSTMTDHFFVVYDIFPSTLNYYGQCQILTVVDADNEIDETDESSLSNEWIFNATIHSVSQ